jgi:hypothetical protein
MGEFAGVFLWAGVLEWGFLSDGQELPNEGV